MSGSCCARLQRANVEFAAVERLSKAVVPKSVQIASAVAYAASHEACAAHAIHTHALSPQPLGISVNAAHRAEGSLGLGEELHNLQSKCSAAKRASGEVAA